jgi:hypothetical protein
MGATITLLALLATTPGTGDAGAAGSAPLADQILLPTYSWDIVGGRVSISRGSGPGGPRLLEDSLTATGLAELLAASPRAVELARTAHRDLQWGYALKYSGLLGALAGVVGISLGAAQITDGKAQLAWNAAGGTLLIAGVAATVIGFVGINSGFARALEAVNAYNLDLVRNR